MKRTTRIPECHPELPHRARGLCNTCYVDYRRGYMRELGEKLKQDFSRHEGVVRTGVRGWGSL